MSSATTNGHTQVTRHGRKAPPANEDSHARFRRLADPRMRSALSAVRLVGNLSADTYKWTDQELDVMRGTLTEAVRIAMQRFEKTHPVKLEDTFDFEELQKEL